MGGHGGLNILPQKRWNVYNFDNREKVRKDEEAAAKEEQLKREQSRKRDFELRLVQLRQARGLAPSARASSPSSESKSKSKSKAPELDASKSKLNHINLFEGIKIFDPVVFGGEGKGEDEGGAFKKMKMAKKEAAPRVVMPEDEKYRLGYGIAGKGVKLPWYLSKPNDDANVEKEDDDDDDDDYHRSGEGAKSGVKKTLEQLREERLKREKKEKERERALILEKRFNRDKKEKERERALIIEKGRRDGPFLKDRGFSRRSGK